MLLVRINGFLDFIHGPVFQKLENAAFWNLDLADVDNWTTLQLRMETDPVSEMYFLVSTIPDDGQSPKTQ
jgi:hypothetical protein